MTMTIYVNQQPLPCPMNTLLADVPALLQLPAQHLAFAVNHTIVHRQQWADFALNHGDQLDAFTLVAGG
ncbi:sulfur carrier protein ThiS [Salinimonas sediminis]|nr:sulfur carrier protein ThiS [Salinimonas sediminis]